MEDADKIKEPVKTGLLVTGYLLLTAAVLYGIYLFGFIDWNPLEDISIQWAILGAASIFSLVFAYSFFND